MTAENPGRDVGAASGIGFSGPRLNFIKDHLSSLGVETDAIGISDLRRYFYIISREEELETQLRKNGHNWEPEYASLESRCDFPIPVIDRGISKIRGLDKRMIESHRAWPEGKAFALCITHDVDIVSDVMLKERLRQFSRAGDSSTAVKLQIALSAVKNAIKTVVGRRKHGLLGLDEWMEVEDSLGFKSSFFFQGQPLPSSTWEDCFYQYTDKIEFEGRHITLLEAIRRIAFGGWDVGVHGSCTSHRDGKILALEKNNVELASEKVVTTSRMHHLFFDAGLTPAALSGAGIAADSSIGSNYQIGFRSGTCHPHFYYDFTIERESSTLCVPLVAQDVALFQQMQMDKKHAVSQCLEIMREVAKHGGVFTILWHNNWQRDSDAFHAFVDILNAASEYDAWGCSLEQLNCWLRKTRFAGKASVG